MARVGHQSHRVRQDAVGRLQDDEAAVQRHAHREGQAEVRRRMVVAVAVTVVRMVVAGRAGRVVRVAVAGVRGRGGVVGHGRR